MFGRTGAGIEIQPITVSMQKQFKMYLNEFGKIIIFVLVIFFLSWLYICLHLILFIKVHLYLDWLNTEFFFFFLKPKTQWMIRALHLL